MGCNGHKGAAGFGAPASASVVGASAAARKNVAANDSAAARNARSAVAAIVQAMPSGAVPVVVSGSDGMSPEQTPEEKQRQAMVEDLAARVLSECRTTLMMAFRYLDSAFWKLPVVSDDFEGTVGTDGARLFFSPRGVVSRFRSDPNEMTRDFLHLILHCVFRQPFETRREHPLNWSYACDICVEAIAMEMCGARFACSDDAQRNALLKQLRSAVDALTPAQVYRLIERLRNADAVLPLSRDELRLAELLNESEPLFVRDSHGFWNLTEPERTDDPDEADRTEEGDDPNQSDNQDGAGATSESGEDDADEQGGQEDASDGESGRGSDGGSGEGRDDAPNDEPDRDESDGGNEDADSSSDNDADGDAGDSSSSDASGKKNPQGDTLDSSDVPRAGAPDGEAAESPQAPPHQTDSQAQSADSSAESSSSSPTDTPTAGSSDAGYDERSLDDVLEQPDFDQAKSDWEDIGKRIQADLETMSKSRGDGAGSLMANLELVNRTRTNYADFLRMFSRMGEDMRLNDDEFDYVYYTYGLSRYGNMPLIEPLEYKESRRVREFVIALDTSGSCSGPLVQHFVERTFEMLKSSEEFGTQVNVHIIQCDAAVQEDTVITSVDDFTRYIDSFQVKGFGGTDFRPLFAYVDELVRAGEFEDLRGLIYFTDGAGIYPDSPPDYDVAFVFVDEGGQKRRVPPWAMRVVIDQEDIRQL